MNPLKKLERSLQTITNTKIGIPIFLGIGGLLTINTFPILAVSAAGTIVFLLEGLAQKYQNKTLNFKTHIFSNLYHAKFNKWFSEYIENSETLTEKKYKLIFSSFLFNEKKNLDLRIFDSHTKLLKEIESELKIKNEDVDLFSIFYDNISKSIVEDLKNDLLDNEKSKSINKVFNDFQHLGLLGKNITFIESNIFKFLSLVQNYSLSDNDFKQIDLINRKNSYSMSNIFIQDFDSLEKIIFNTSKENLEHLKALFHIRGFESLYTSNLDSYSPLESIEKHEQYLIMQEKLPQKTKKLKIRI